MPTWTQTKTGVSAQSTSMACGGSLAVLIAAIIILPVEVLAIGRLDLEPSQTMSVLC